MDSPLLELTGIEKSFGGVRALRGVSLTLARGEVHALLGENGAGKSTLIKVITGAHAPDRGSVSVAGELVGSFSPAAAHRLGIACIYQQPALFPHLTVAENIELALEPPNPWRRVRRRQRRERARVLLQRIGASIDPEREAQSLSMPEQQLVEIAKAVGAEARVLIMDEPTASLTSGETAALLEVVRGLRQAGTGVIYITHRLEETFEIADRVTVLRDGSSVASLPIRVVNEAELIRLMVGRELQTVYPPSHTAPAGVRLRVQNLGSAEAGVHGVSFEVRAGEIFALAGLIGAGRTELARVLFGLTPAETGSIELDGNTIRPRTPREAIAHGLAYVPEDRRRHGVILPLPIAANISLASHRRLFPHGWLRPAAERKVAGKYRREFAIRAPSVEVPVETLSGGNQQKVALARWLATQPKVLILDEPTQGVDVGAKGEIHTLIRQLAAEGLAVILISSDLPEVLGMSDRIGVMRAGRLVEVFEAAGATADRIMAATLGGAAA